MPEIQSDKYDVSITLVSLQDGQRNVMEANGEVTSKGPHLYIQYEELEQGPRGEEVSVRTTIKIAGNQLKLIRHGGFSQSRALKLDGVCQDSTARHIRSSIFLRKRTSWKLCAKGAL